MLWLSAALAQSWTHLDWGVEYAQWTTNEPNRISALRVNLCHPGLEVHATATGDRGQRTSTWANSQGLAGAVNGGFFKGGYGPDQGVAMGGGVEWPDSADSAVRAWYAFGPRTLHFSVAPAVEALPSWAEQAVNGDATLVYQGAAVDCGGCGAGRAPRTAIGSSQDAKTLVLVAVDGRSSSSRGMTIDELAVLMDSLDVYWAMNLDGGGSTTLWTHTHGVANVPSDGSERVVGNHLGFKTPGTGLARFCPTGWAAEFVGLDFPGSSGTTVSAPAGSVVSGTITLKNTGSETWDTSLTRLAPLPRDAASRVGGDDWIAGHRVTAVDASTAPGQQGTFSFSFRMPDQVGTSRWDFSVLQEGVAWFGNSWGPVDGTFYLTLDATEPLPEDTEPPDTDPPPDDTEPTRDSTPPADTSGAVPFDRQRLGGCGHAPVGTGVLAWLLLSGRRRS